MNCQMLEKVNKKMIAMQGVIEAGHKVINDPKLKDLPNVVALRGALISYAMIAPIIN